MKSTLDKGEEHSLQHKHQKYERFFQRRKTIFKNGKKKNMDGVRIRSKSCIKIERKEMNCKKFGIVNGHRDES
jgi:hypothetical protein